MVCLEVPESESRATSHRADSERQGLPRCLQLRTGLCAFLLLLLWAEIPTTKANDYCSITCRGEAHTMCIYPEGPGANCSVYQPDPLSPAERAAVLHTHNHLRNEMALGKIPHYSTASDMLEMAWDEELAQIAQRWADQCTFKHDKCRNAQRFNVGQNLAVFFTNGFEFPLPESRVQSWYDEISLYSHGPGPFHFSVETGHFTQIVWSSTNLVGCARTRYNINNFVHQLLVCNYGPAGNILGRPLYTAGAPCSQCTCSARYSGLCAIGSIIPTEDNFSFGDFYSPFSLGSTTQAPSFFGYYTTTPPPVSYITNPPIISKQSNLIIQPRFSQVATTIRPTQKPFTYPTTTTTRRTVPPTETKKPTYAVTTKKPAYQTSYYQTTQPTKKLTYQTSYYQTTQSTKQPAYQTSYYQTTQPTKKATYQPSYYQTTQPTKKATYQTSYYQTTQATKKPAYQTYYQTTQATKTTAVAQRFTETVTAPTTTATFLPISCPLPSGPGLACGVVRPAPLPLSASDRAALLRLHNKWRAEIARGGVSGFPAAADMRQLVWDEELAETAQRWADQCIWGHDPCRKTSRFGLKGQSIALSYNINEAVEQRVLEWFDEARLAKFTDGPFQFAVNSSRFTQLAWADTTSLGCARSRFPSAGVDANLLVCNYGPSGNILGKKLYTPGAPCSRCGFSGCSSAYPSLCTPTSAGSTSVQLTTPTYATTITTTTPRTSQSQRANELDAAFPVKPYKSVLCPRRKGPGAACGDKYRASPLSAAEREALLDAHNSLRNRVASGLVKKLPGAANMNQLEWDDKLAEFAQSWADQCTLGYDSCAVTDSYTAGQNMAIWYSHDLDIFPPPQERVNGWFKEIDNYNYTNGLFAFNPDTAALTQLLWGSTRKLGCGRSRFITRAPGTEVAAEFLVCDYGPGGNILNDRIYQSGQPCSKCEFGTKCSSKWPALCTR